MSDPPEARPLPTPLPPLLGEPESPEVLQIHRAILEAEKPEPVEGLEPAPWWVWAISVVTVFAMGFYLGRYSGTFSADPDELYQKVSPGGAAQAAAESALPGDAIFAGICMPCHQAGGAGVEGRYPPLAGSEWLTGDPSLPVRILLNGLSGPITARGSAIEGQMPALGGQLSDANVAAVLTYARSSFGNRAGPVTPELVAKIRAQTGGQGPWTAQRLLALPAAEVKK